jgi:2-oxoglutarate ferredoxin oxidoreductase subunit alpha
MLSDLDIGMNDWVVPRLTWDDSYRPDRGRVLDAADLEGMETFARYTDPDADFVTARTLPGVSAQGAYFARGTGHTTLGLYTEKPDEYQEVVDRLARKHSAAAAHVPAPTIDATGSELALVTLGSCDIAVREAVDLLRQRGVDVDYMRVRGFPFGGEVQSFLSSHETIFVVEQNRDGQLRSLLTTETTVDKARLESILVYGGYPLSAGTVVDVVIAWKEG